MSKRRHLSDVSRSLINNSQRQAVLSPLNVKTKRPRLQIVGHDTYELVDDETNDHKQAQPHIHHMVRRSACFRQTSQISLPSEQHDESKNGNSSKPPMLISVTGDQMAKYFQLLGKPLIQKFMKHDTCLRLTDKYLLAMCFAYFARAQFSSSEYTIFNFFAALYLANDVEEDEEEYKYEILPWVLGKMWRVNFRPFLHVREELWKRMGYRAIVSKKCCDEIMAIEPNHPVWTRERKEHHGGAIRPWLKEKCDDGRLIGPDGSPMHCSLCNYPPKSSSKGDSLSPDNDCILLRVDTSASSPEVFTAANITNGSPKKTTEFCMIELQNTLLCSSNKTDSSGKGKSLTSTDTNLDWVEYTSHLTSPYQVEV